jgi:hypothetical protein
MTPLPVEESWKAAASFRGDYGYRLAVGAASDAQLLEVLLYSRLSGFCLSSISIMLYEEWRGPIRDNVVANICAFNWRRTVKIRS